MAVPVCRAGEVKLCVRPQTRIWTCSGVDAGSGARDQPESSVIAQIEISDTGEKGHHDRAGATFHKPLGETCGHVDNACKER